MQLTPKVLTELQNRLKIGNRRGVHLNATPQRSPFKFDLQRLSDIDETLPNQFLQTLLSKKSFNFRIKWKDYLQDNASVINATMPPSNNIAKSFESLINQTESIEAEKGINTFGFGFPVLVRRDQLDDKLTVAPIFIWSLRIKRSSKEFNTWEIIRTEDDPIYMNEVLINHLYNDSKVVIPPIPSEMLDDGFFSKDNVAMLCSSLLKAIDDTSELTAQQALMHKLSDIKGIEEKAYYENLLRNSISGFIEFGGIFSIFEVQKQNIIEDYDRLLKAESSNLDLENFLYPDTLEHCHFQSISGVQTDPSQQGILHALEKKRNILIQGPPGTGKSQTLMAVLINALENHKKTLVVCEKRTALDVLHQALIEKELGNHCILIRDTMKDRKAVITSVRDRLDEYVSQSVKLKNRKGALARQIVKAKGLIDTVNEKHQKLDAKLLGDKNWTTLVGELLAELKKEEGSAPVSISDADFSFTSEEFNKLLDDAKQGEALYSAYMPCITYAFLNPEVFRSDNLYQLEEELKSNFSVIQKEINALNGLLANQTWFQKIFHLKLWRSVRELKKRINANHLTIKPIQSSGSAAIIAEINELMEQSRLYFEKKQLFAAEYYWQFFYLNLDSQTAKIVDELKGHENWYRHILIKYLQSALVHFASHQLPTDDAELLELGNTISGLGQEQLNYIRNYWITAQTEAAAAFSTKHENLAVENLYNKRSSTKHKRLALRQIVQYDLDFFTTFFPVVLTSPDIASNLFLEQYEYFDIVMFDEASQLRFEDNLPAILKGKQRVIAGDEHQMPPTNYFSKLFDGIKEDEDELEEEANISVNPNDLLLACESLIDFGLEHNFYKRYLDFHYRSRHPYLIDFSNYAFYNQRLKPLPNTFHYTPIKYYAVNGTFSQHINEAEADQVISILENHIHRLPNGKYPSVGIATFNITQRNFIISKILARQKSSKSTAFNAKIMELQENGLFIKNLENIQGDERDIIIISTTYGRGRDGKYAKRFGPINHSKGYKLLNVIITRAKYKVFVCCSIPEEAFLNYKSELEREGANNKSAVFYAYLAYSKAVSESNTEARNAILQDLAENSGRISSMDFGSMGNPEAAFEQVVHAWLSEKLDRDKLHLHMKVSEFQLDIVYDTQKTGVPKIAIECDGTKYHASREAYLYDMHRKHVLENHGFVFHRIWSTNWWRDPQFEVQRLVEFIQSVESGACHNLPDTSDWSAVFEDQFAPADR